MVISTVGPAFIHGFNSKEKPPLVLYAKPESAQIKSFQSTHATFHPQILEQILITFQNVLSPDDQNPNPQIPSISETLFSFLGFTDSHSLYKHSITLLHHTNKSSSPDSFSPSASSSSSSSSIDSHFQTFSNHQIYSSQYLLNTGSISGGGYTYTNLPST